MALTKNVSKTSNARIKALYFVPLISLFAFLSSGLEARADDWIEDESNPEIHRYPNGQSTTTIETLPFRKKGSEKQFRELCDEAQKSSEGGDFALAILRFRQAVDCSGFLAWSDPRVFHSIKELRDLSIKLGRKTDSAKYQRWLNSIYTPINNSSVGPYYSSKNITAKLLIADSFALEGRYNEAEQCYLSCLGMRDSDEIELFLQAMIAERLARLHIKTKDLEKAKHDLDVIGRQVENQYSLDDGEANLRAFLCILSAQTSLLLAEGKLEQADISSKRCLQLLGRSRSDNKYRKFVLLSDRGEYYILKGDHKAAISYFDKALACANRGKPLSNVNQKPVLEALTSACQATGQTTRASHLLEKITDPAFISQFRPAP